MSVLEELNWESQSKAVVSAVAQIALPENQTEEQGDSDDERGQKVRVTPVGSLLLAGVLEGENDQSWGCEGEK